MPRLHSARAGAAYAELQSSAVDTWTRQSELETACVTAGERFGEVDLVISAMKRSTGAFAHELTELLELPRSLYYRRVLCIAGYCKCSTPKTSSCSALNSGTQSIDLHVAKVHVAWVRVTRQGRVQMNCGCKVPNSTRAPCRLASTLSRDQEHRSAYLCAIPALRRWSLAARVQLDTHFVRTAFAAGQAVSVAGDRLVCVLEGCVAVKRQLFGGGQQAKQKRMQAAHWQGRLAARHVAAAELPRHCLQDTDVCSLPLQTHLHARVSVMRGQLLLCLPLVPWRFHLPPFVVLQVLCVCAGLPVSAMHILRPNPTWSRPHSGANSVRSCVVPHQHGCGGSCKAGRQRRSAGSTASLAVHHRKVRKSITHASDDQADVRLFADDVCLLPCAARILCACSTLCLLSMPNALQHKFTKAHTNHRAGA